MPAKHPMQVFEGRKYYRDRSGYWDYSPPKQPLHHDVWIAANGPIPQGHVIHHKDHDTNNNTLQNLELCNTSDHAKYHSRHRLARDPQCFSKAVKAAIAVAPAWHKSDEGRAWHRKHSRHVWANMQKEDRKCPVCGKTFQAPKGFKKRGFCSANCQSKARRNSGIDDEERTCQICGNKFTVNKYARKIMCGTRCQGKLQSLTKRHLRSYSDTQPLLFC